MSDLVARLRAAGPRPGRQCGAMSGAGYRCKLDFGHRPQHEWDRGPWPDFPALCAEAADRIEVLEREMALWNPGGLPFDSGRQVRR